MKSRKITFSAIIAALSLIFLYGAFLVPSGKIALYAIASVCLAAVVIECGSKTALLCYMAISLLAFFLIPDKSFVLPFILFFGYYPILKSGLERTIKNRVGEYLAKLLVGNIAFFLIFFIIKTLFVAALAKTSLLILWVGANLVFVLYDVAFSMIIEFYNTRIHNKMSFK